MKDNEIKQALPFLAKYCKDEYNDIRVDEVLLGAFDIINRQQADNERLKKLLEEAEAKYTKCAKRFYKEGIKEFAKRLKEYYINHKRYKRPYAHTLIDYLFDIIDDLVKEMVGDAE